ncbi:MAG: hypothetical protein AB3N13_12875 [Arenibacterium sp.]
MDATTAIAAYNSISFPIVSLFASGIVLFITLPLAAVLGYVSGARTRRRQLKNGREIELVLGETTLAAILALLGLLLAFSFGHALSLSNTNKITLIEEAAALGTAFARADILADPGRTELQVALLEYAETRLFDEVKTMTTAEAQASIQKSLEAQAKLWPLTIELVADPLPPALKAFVASSINDVLDAHLLRTQTLSTPVSEVANAMLLAIVLTALFLLGNRAGAQGRALTWRTFVFSGFLFVITLTIADIQRSEQGTVQIDKTAMHATILEMRLALRDRL